ncbi:MAG: NAD(P)H-dependent oxidoreductase [Myxococcota bacterium]
MLVIFAHPALEHSHVNRQLFTAIQDLPDLETRDLYELYPDYDVDIAAEQAALLRHEFIVFQHPIYWYNVPPLLKQWQDLVLEHGWAYGHDGKMLHGKAVMHAVTTGGPGEGYSADGVHRFTLAELMRPQEQTAHLCGMHWREPFVVYRAHSLEAGEIAREAERFSVTLRGILEHAA